MDTFNGLLPHHPEVKETDLYPCLKFIGILGILEAILGLVEVGLETSGLTLYYELRKSYKVEIWGLSVGFLVIFTGTWGYLTQLSLIRPRPRHCMFVIGTFLTFIAGSAVFALLRFSAETATIMFHPGTKIPPDTLLTIWSGNSSSIYTANQSEANFILGTLRATCAVVYTLLGFMFLTSFMLNCKNIREINERGQRSSSQHEIFRRFSSLGKQKSDDQAPERERIVDKNGYHWILPLAAAHEDDAQ